MWQKSGSGTKLAGLKNRTSEYDTTECQHAVGGKCRCQQNGVWERLSYVPLWKSVDGGLGTWKNSGAAPSAGSKSCVGARGSFPRAPAEAGMGSPGPSRAPQAKPSSEMLPPRDAITWQSAPVK